jgi:REP element-mobilizing transposase RayT
MPQSLARLHHHLIFSTKNRAPLIAAAHRASLHAYMSTVLKNIDCPAILINSVDDHVHMLFEMSRTVTVSQAVEEVKKSSSKWMKADGKTPSFTWQAGYAVFSVSESSVDPVCKYIANQGEHHRKKTFQEELRSFLERHKVKYDERYVWD